MPLLLAVRPRFISNNNKMRLTPPRAEPVPIRQELARVSRSAHRMSAF